MGGEYGESLHVDPYGHPCDLLKKLGKKLFSRRGRRGFTHWELEHSLKQNHMGFVHKRVDFWWVPRVGTRADG